MSYQEALEAAGAKVKHYEQFGDWQGSWYAVVEYNDETGMVYGEYGSCSGCDAFEAEFSYKYEDTPEYKERLKEFGRQYLDNIVSFEKALDNVAKYATWDLEADKLTNWIKERMKEENGKNNESCS